MFILALFTTAKIWKQPRCPSTDEWEGEQVPPWTHTPHTQEQHSVIKKHEILPSAASWVDLEGILSKVI